MRTSQFLHLFYAKAKRAGFKVEMISSTKCLVCGLDLSKDIEAAKRIEKTHG
jgi:hypothetical protein